VVRVALAVVHDLREARAPAGPDELAAFETDTLAGLVLARAAAGLADSTIAGEVIHLEQVIPEGAGRCQGGFCALSFRPWPVFGRAKSGPWPCRAGTLAWLFPGRCHLG